MSATLCWLVEMDLPSLTKRGWHYVCEVGDSGWVAIVSDDNSTPAQFHIAARKGTGEIRPKQAIAYESLDVAKREALDLVIEGQQLEAKLAAKRVGK